MPGISLTSHEVDVLMVAVKVRRQALQLEMRGLVPKIRELPYCEERTQVSACAAQIDMEDSRLQAISEKLRKAKAKAKARK
jgi:hypothetical protein